MYFALLFRNPFYYKSTYKGLWFYHKPATKNKHIEFEIVKDNYNCFKLELEWSRDRSHAGFSFELNLFTFSINGRFYDIRHWDYENNCWKDENHKK